MTAHFFAAFFLYAVPASGVVQTRTKSGDGTLLSAGKALLYRQSTALNKASGIIIYISALPID